MKQVMLAVFTLGLLSVYACAHPRHTAVVVDVALYTALHDVHVVEQTALCGLPTCASSAVVEFVPGWTAAKSRDFNGKLLPAVEGGLGFNDLLRAWRPGTPMPAGLVGVINSLGAALTHVTTSFPESPTKTKLLAGIAQAQTMVLQALSIVLMVSQ
jgi:hypothetical protein